MSFADAFIHLMGPQRIQGIIDGHRGPNGYMAPAGPNQMGTMQALQRAHINVGPSMQPASMPQQPMQNGFPPLAGLFQSSMTSPNAPVYGQPQTRLSDLMPRSFPTSWKTPVL